MEVNLVSQIGQCAEFIAEGSKKKEPVSIVIYPLRIDGGKKEGDLNVITGCNMFEGCFNVKCRFSAAARSVPRAIKK